jgi:hypothetical protein
MGRCKLPEPYADEQGGYAFACDDGRLLKATCTPNGNGQHRVATQILGEQQPQVWRILERESCSQFITRLLDNPGAVHMELRL